MTAASDQPLQPTEVIARLERELNECRQEANDLRLQLDVLSTSDFVTGLPNIHGMVDLIEDLTARIGRSREHFGIMMIRLPELAALARDMDAATYRQGTRHAAGLIVAGLRQLDRVGRIHTDAFLVTLPQLKANGVDKVVERVTQTLGAVPMRLDDGATVPFRPEIGLVVCHPDATREVPALLEAVWEAQKEAQHGTPSVVAAPDASKPRDIHLS